MDVLTAFHMFVVTAQAMLTPTAAWRWDAVLTIRARLWALEREGQLGFSTPEREQEVFDESYRLFAELDEHWTILEAEHPALLDGTDACGSP